MKKLLYLALVILLCSCSDDDETNYTVKTATFENTDHVKAGPTAYGDNLYIGYMDKETNNYTAYTDEATNLIFPFTPDEFSFSGFALSNWNNIEDASYLNQCSVYSGENKKNNGGYNKSHNFMLAYLYSDIEFHFNKEDEENIISHFYVNNTTYAALTTQNGNAYSNAASYEKKDFVKLTIEGLDASGKSKGTTEVYLADYRIEGKGGILKEWTKVDTSSLGKIHSLKFSISVSDNLKNQWGITIPTYFCIDEIVVHKEN